jgi:riboflavin synthase
MFTGIIRASGEIISINKKEQSWHIGIATALPLQSLKIGDSVACSGACLTLVAINENNFFVDVSAETLARTNLRFWQINQRVNLEPALCLGEALGGHLVSGHVDDLAKIESIDLCGDCYKITFSVSAPYHRFIAEKGSVSLDGISLTVNQVVDKNFAVMIIPHTWSHTNLSERGVGDFLNLEIDLLARYTARLLETA